MNQELRKLVDNLILEVADVDTTNVSADTSLESLGLDLLKVWDLEEELMDRFNLGVNLSLNTTLEHLVKGLGNADFTGAC